MRSVTVNCHILISSEFIIFLLLATHLQCLYAAVVLDLQCNLLYIVMISHVNHAL